MEKIKKKQMEQMKKRKMNQLESSFELSEERSLEGFSD
tara:strand:+ start:274 stop:387 length:114 start_codon:yes stop_codon:yes gene_type:complete